MSFEYVEIQDKTYIPDCIRVHKKIFNLSDADAFPSAFFSMLIRKEHPLGIVIGCFCNKKGQRELIGLIVTMADIEVHSLYCVLIGVLPDYQNGFHGYRFAIRLREIAIQRNITRINGIYNPLEANLGKLYAFIGGITTRYIPDPYSLNYMIDSIDKVLYTWHLTGRQTEKKLNGQQKLCFRDAVTRYPVIKDNVSMEPEFLFEIPSNYSELMIKDTDKAKYWRNHTRNILSEYLNNKGYYITECLSGCVDGEKKTYYLLSKQLTNEQQPCIYSAN